MSDNPKSARQKGLSVTVELSGDAAGRLDAWIASQPEPRLSRAAALCRLADLGINHGREIEIYHQHIAQADRDIRAMFDQLADLLKLAAAHVADDGDGQKHH